MDGIIARGVYVGSSEYVRNLIHKYKEQRTELEAIRAKPIKAEKSEFTNMTRDGNLAQAKEKLQRNGKL